MNKHKFLMTKDKTPNKQEHQSLERHNKVLKKELELRKKEIEFLASAYCEHEIEGYAVTVQEPDEQ